MNKTPPPAYGDQLVGWAFGAALAAVAFLLLLVLGGFGFFAGAFLAAVIFVLVGGMITWLFCAPLPKPGTVPPPGQRVSTKPVSGHTAHAPKVPASPVASKAPSAATAAPVTTAAPAKAAAPAKTEAKPEAKPAPSPSEAGGGTRPQALGAPRGGQADNLKEIRGVGPKLETLCHDLGIYHFDQIAGWGPDEVTWMDENLKGFKGRVTRDDWVNQAKILATGGDTEFSKRVDEGNVY